MSEAVVIIRAVVRLTVKASLSSEASNGTGLIKTEFGPALPSLGRRMLQKPELALDQVVPAYKVQMY